MTRPDHSTRRLRRRAVIAGGRILRSRPGGGPSHPSVFLHMPKCGGTSLSEAMYATVPVGQRIGVIDARSTRRAAAMVHLGKDDDLMCHEDLEHGQATFDLREGMLLQHMAWGTKLIHGHVQWSERAERHFGDRYKYVTVLRDPVERMISNFRMTQRNGVIESDLDAYLEGPVARRHARVYLRYLAGANDIADEDVPAALEIAQTRISRFTLVGFLDRMDGFLEKYRNLFGVRLSPGRLNAAPDGPSGYTSTQMERIRDLCKADMTLLEHAREQWG